MSEPALHWNHPLRADNYLLNSLLEETSAHSVSIVAHHGQHGVIARQTFAPGDVILHMEGERRVAPDRHTLQLDDNFHLASAESQPGGYPAWRYINHACEPNSAVRGRDFVAILPIHPGDPITFNYNTTEYHMASPFTCTCASPFCVGVVSGFRYLDPIEQERLRPLLAPHLLRRLRPA